MNPHARRWLRWTFIAAFFAVAPVVILSTAGYRYNFARHRLERTGAMVVESRPDDARILLNGRIQKTETPSRFGKVIPGTYAVRVEKDGYRPWTKTVVVSSRETAFLNRISLFREDAPAALATFGAYGAAAFSPQARYGAAVASASSGSELIVIDTQTGEMRLPYRSSTATESFRLAWSPSGRRLLVVQETETPVFLLWNASQPDRIEDLSARAETAWSEAFWAQDEEALYGVADGELHEIDTDTFAAATEGPAVSEPVVVDQTLYGIVPGKAAKLVRRRLQDREFETIAELPSVEFRPVAGADGRVSYASASSERLFTIDATARRPAAFEGRGRDGAWSDDASQLLYWNEFEVRLYDARSGSDTVMNRLSDPILQAAWHRPDWNALYVSGNTLYAIETREQFGRTHLPLTTFQDLRRFAVSPNGNTAFIFGIKDGLSGLWRLRLR